MKQAYANSIEAMPGHTLLPECKSYNSELGFTCNALDVGLDSYVECLETYAPTCPFSVSYAHSYYCKCTARVYICKNIGK